MKCEDISDALGLLDERMIGHTLMVRRKKKKTRSNRKYIAAASLCLVFVGVAAA